MRILEGKILVVIKFWIKFICLLLFFLIIENFGFNFIFVKVDRGIVLVELNRFWFRFEFNGCKFKDVIWLMFFCWVFDICICIGSFLVFLIIDFFKFFFSKFFNCCERLVWFNWVKWIFFLFSCSCSWGWILFKVFWVWVILGIWVKRFLVCFFNFCRCFKLGL